MAGDRRHTGQASETRQAGFTSPSKVRALKAEGLGATEIATAMGIGRASVYRVLGTYSSSGPPRADSTT
jgi:DNA invertase Pin-like site-specific DNA recombinase